MTKIQPLLDALKTGNIPALARCISLVENSVPGYEALLQQLPATQQPVIGITGAPGAGKSTITNALIEKIIQKSGRVAVLCIDPSSPFNRGALLGDRLRMHAWYNHPQVYIRSVASRGALGGLCPTVLAITDVLRAAPFDYVIIETVGVGQNEVEIAALASVTVVVYVPEAGDEVQTMKAGLAEIADVFVVNKADRPGARPFARHLQALAAQQHKDIPVIQTVATEEEGIQELFDAILEKAHCAGSGKKYLQLLTNRAYRLILQQKMNEIDRVQLEERLQQAYDKEDFNIYRFAAQFK